MAHRIWGSRWKKCLLGQERFFSPHGPQTELTFSLMTLGVFRLCCFPLSAPARPPQVSAMVFFITESALACEPCGTKVVSRGGSSSLISRSADKPAPLIELLGNLDLHSYLPLG